MKSKLFCAVSLVFLMTLSSVSGAETEVIPQARKYTEQYTPAGEKCTKEADEKGLISHEWRKFMAVCMRQNRSARPYEKEVEFCFKQRDGISSTEKHEVLKKCLASIDYSKKLPQQKAAE